MIYFEIIYRHMSKGKHTNVQVKMITKKIPYAYFHCGPLIHIYLSMKNANKTISRLSPVQTPVC